MENRKKILKEIDLLTETYCTDCFLYRTNRKEKGRKYAHSFCIRSCSIGEKLQFYGHQLLEESNQRKKLNRIEPLK